jgi:hypothetical protein
MLVETSLRSQRYSKQQVQTRKLVHVSLLKNRKQSSLKRPTFDRHYAKLYIEPVPVPYSLRDILW